MNNIDFFFTLIRLGIGNKIPVNTDLQLYEGKIDWNEIENLAVRHGLSAIIVDGIEKIPTYLRPPKEHLLKIIGTIVQTYENRYYAYKRAISELSRFYCDNGIKMMVIKGYACGIDWPRPEHRPYGDIDVWLFGDYKKADEVIKKAGLKIFRGLHHHTVFYWRNFMVENHYDFVNTHSGKVNEKIERIFKELGMDDSCYMNVCNEKVYLPSPNLHALFLLKHSMAHFASTNITIRQILDWAFFVKKHSKEIDWEWLIIKIDEYHLKDFFNIINAICVVDLGFSVSLFPSVQYDIVEKDMVFEDIINPKYCMDEPRGVLKRIVFKYKRWKSNAWKRKMCYEGNESLFFIRSLWKHLLKPTSI